jgi:hypothetical protein
MRASEPGPDEVGAWNGPDAETSRLVLRPAATRRRRASVDVSGTERSARAGRNDGNGGGGIAATVGDDLFG